MSVTCVVSFRNRARATVHKMPKPANFALELTRGPFLGAGKPTARRHAGCTSLPPRHSSVAAASVPRGGRHGEPARSSATDVRRSNAQDSPRSSARAFPSPQSAVAALLITFRSAGLPLPLRVRARRPCPNAHLRSTIHVVKKDLT